MRGSASCRLRADAMIGCWSEHFPLYSFEFPGTSYESVDAGFPGVCGLRGSGCWTCLQEVIVHVPLDPAPEDRFRIIDASSFHMCGVRIDRGVTCWGDNEFGESSHTLWGGPGDDRLYGAAHDDQPHGGTGDDTRRGGAP